MKTKTIILPNGSKLQARFLGAGSFAKCYLAEDGFVYSFLKQDTSEFDYSKEGIALWADSDNSHIPQIESLGEDDKNNQVYKSVYYSNSLQAKNKAAWQEYKTLKKIWLTVKSEYGNDHNNQIINLARAEGVKESICDALQSINDALGNYSARDYFFEFRPVNLKVSDSGELILLDVIYNKKALNQKINKKLFS